MTVWVLAALLGVHNVWWNRARLDAIKAGYHPLAAWVLGFIGGAFMVGGHLVTAAFILWVVRLFGG